MVESLLKNRLDQVYQNYNRKKYLHPDPLEFLLNYNNPWDREIVGLLAASLAYGRVAQILKSVSLLLYRMGPCPREYILTSDHRSFFKDFSTFTHRFATGRHISALMTGMKHAVENHGDLNTCFLRGVKPDDTTVLSGLIHFVRELTANGSYETGHLIPDPKRGSACKRLNLFLRWMVRKDRVDPGGWKGVPASKLIVPLDTHMYRIGSFLGFTKRKQADFRTALEITDGFRALRPEDPVRYDFALTRLGIRGDLDLNRILDGIMLQQFSAKLK